MSQLSYVCKAIQIRPFKVMLCATESTCTYELKYLSSLAYLQEPKWLANKLCRLLMACCYMMRSS